MNYAQLIKHYGQLLEACGEEVENFIYVLKDLKQWSTTDYLLNQNNRSYFYIIFTKKERMLNSKNKKITRA